MEQQIPLSWSEPARPRRAWHAAVMVVRIVVLASIIGFAVVCLASTLDRRFDMLFVERTE